MGEGKKPYDCTLCEKKFSKKNNLNQHFERHHDESKNKVSDNARNYIKEIFKNIKLTGRKHRKEVAAETAIKMKEIMDEFDQPIFKPDEYLDAVQINTLLYSFTQVENKKMSRHLNKKKIVKKKRKQKKVKIEAFDIDDHDDPITGEAMMEISKTEFVRLNHPICLDEIVLCDLANVIMNSKINEPSPLENLEEKTIIAIGNMVGLVILDKHLAARDRK